jgi:hypothetical protein
MMKTQKTVNAAVQVALTSLFVFGASACSSTIARYEVSASNIETMKQLQIKPIAVDTFESIPPGLYSLGGCRTRESIETPQGFSFASYIRQAFTDELKLAGLYDSNSALIIRGRLDKISFDSTVPTGKWVMTFTVASPKDPGFSIESKHEFSTNVVGSKACRQVADAYSTAVQQLIKQIISDPRFKQLLDN